ncbi:ATP synthase subunit alpha [Nymphaea thermarum]|nr:ATP synthase subunit alpha [Nymphaea thermarum]
MAWHYPFPEMVAHPVSRILLQQCWNRRTWRQGRPPPFERGMEALQNCSGEDCFWVVASKTSSIFTVSIADFSELFSIPNNMEFCPRAEELTTLLERRMTDFYTNFQLEENSLVVSIGDGIARVYGLDDVQAREMVEFAAVDTAIKEGDLVKGTSSIVDVPVGKDNYTSADRWSHERFNNETSSFHHLPRKLPQMLSKVRNET